MRLNFDARRNMTRLDLLCSSLPDIREQARNLKIISWVVKNWYDVVMFRFGLKKRMTMRFRDGAMVDIRSQGSYLDFWWKTKLGQEEMFRFVSRLIGTHISASKGIASFKKFGRTIKFYYDPPTKWNNTAGMIQYFFHDDPYGFLKPEGKDIIDIGASIGDSAIYFSAKGATHVYAFEPYSFTYGLAKRNIQLNKLNQKITLVNAAGAGRHGRARVDRFTTSPTATLKNSSTGRRIEMLTLEDISKRYKIKKAGLKIDCEGWEYDIIMNSSAETLQKFGRIMIEYHYGYKNIEGKLKNAGFSVSHSHPRHSASMYVGMLHAKLNAE